jgi:hypothetical protein
MLVVMVARLRVMAVAEVAEVQLVQVAPEKMAER